MNKFFLVGLCLLLLTSCKKTDPKQNEVPDAKESINNVEIVNKIYSAFAKGEIDVFMGLLDPKVEWNEAENFPYADNSPYIGPDALKEGVLSRIGQDWEYWNVGELELYDMANDMVLATARYQGKFKSNGNVINAQVAHIWSLNQGKIIKFQQYVDTKQVAEAMMN